MRHPFHNRIFNGLLIISVAVAVLILRLAWVQLFMKNQPVPGSKYTLAKMAEVQSEREAILDTGRGHLFDRNGIPLAGETIWTAAFFPQEEHGVASEVEVRAMHRLADVLGTSYTQLESTITGMKKPFLWPSVSNKSPLALSQVQAEEVSSLGIDGIKVLPFARRYDGGGSGRQWLGYLSEASDKPQSATEMRIPLTGTAGLEKTLEPLLHGVGHTEVYAQVDARGNRLPRSDLKVRTPANPYYPLSVYTTVDKKLQVAIEELTVKAGIKEGAVVVLDVNTGDIVSMVSRPFYNPEDISPQNGEWNNRALQVTEPGSIFKIVTAAAALESGVTTPNEVFYCKGEYDKYGLSCHQGKGHGPLTLAEGFALSCNTVFASLAERLSGVQLQYAALSLGMGREIGWQAINTLGMDLLKPLAGEQRGTIFTTLDPDDNGARVQTAIGQRDVRVSPLQAANLIVTLLHGGEVTSPRIVQRINFANGQKLMTFPLHLTPTTGRRISAPTTELLLSWMRKVVTEGTGTSLLSSNWPLAGKSGTAQTLVKGIRRNNQWFIGYGPVDQPKYAVAVLVQNVVPGSRHAATNLFGQVMDLLSRA